MDDLLGEELVSGAKTRNDLHSKSIQKSGALEHQILSPNSDKNPKPVGPNAQEFGCHPPRDPRFPKQNKR